MRALNPALFLATLATVLVASAPHAWASPEATVKRPRNLYHWELGAWVGGLGLGGAEPEGGRGSTAQDPHGFGGVGLQARYRLRRRWGLELSWGILHSEGSGGTARDMTPGTASLLYYPNPSGLLQLYGLAGLGVGPTRWFDKESDATIGSSLAGLAQVGCGATLDLHPLHLHADIRGVLLEPSLGADGDHPADGARPCTGCGEGEPADALRSDRHRPLAGTSVVFGATLVF